MTARALDAAIATFDAEDQLILRMRFWHDRRVADIAADLHLDQKKTYKRIDKLLHKLLIALERAGVSKEIAENLVVHSDYEIHIRENDPTRPSNVQAGDFGDERRLSK